MPVTHRFHSSHGDWNTSNRENATMTFDTEVVQTFHVTIKWSPESNARLTEGDIREALEDMASEMDEDSNVDVTEQID
jgi:hypothetical protein